MQKRDWRDDLGFLDVVQDPIVFLLFALCFIALAYMLKVPEASHGGEIHCPIVRWHGTKCSECP